MYPRFTDRARKVVKLAGEEAKRSNRESVGAEHILLALLLEGSGVAANVLRNVGLDLKSLCRKVGREIEPAPGGIYVRKLPLSPAAKRVFVHAMEEAKKLRHNYVGTEHLLLAMSREPAGAVSELFAAHGLSAERLRQETLELLGNTHAPVPLGSVVAARVKASVAAIMKRVSHFLRASRRD